MTYQMDCKVLLDPSEPDLLLSQPDVSPGKNLAKARRPAAARPSKKAVPIGKTAKATKRQTSARPARSGAKHRETDGQARDEGSIEAGQQATAKTGRQTGRKGRRVAEKPSSTDSPQTGCCRAGSAPPPEPPTVPKKPSFYEAIAIYESGVRGLQRHDYPAAAESFRQVLQRYPEERELIERARLYLRVCERETAQRPAGPQTTAERVYAATMSLSAGDSDAALGHVRRALDQEPASHHAHYMMAVIHSTRAETAKAVEHLRRAIELNPDSRSLARQDADLERLRESPTVKSLLEETTPDLKGRARARR